MKTRLHSRIIGLAALFLMFIASASAQVTIGMSEYPMEGSLLQLKNKSAYSWAADNSTAGLGLPHVELQSLKLLNMGSLKVPANQWLNHRGLLVYNVVEQDAKNAVGATPAQECLRKGLHVWDGAKWQPLAPYTDSCDGTTGGRAALVQTEDAPEGENEAEA